MWMTVSRAVVLVGVTLVATAGLGQASDFDARVSEARRSMRASCTAVKKAMKTPGEQVDELRAAAVEDARHAEAAWQRIRDEFADTVPHGYAGDPMWKTRLNDIVLNMQRMHNSLENGELRAGFLACAHTCGMIGAMHEANGVRLPVDAMASLRKKIKVLKGLVKTDKAAAIRVVPEVLRLRDQVLLTPIPDASSRQAYVKALPELSAAVDAVAEAVRSQEDLVSATNDLRALVETVYESTL